MLNVVPVAKYMSGDGQGTGGLCSEKLLSISHQTKIQTSFEEVWLVIHGEGHCRSPELVSGAIPIPGQMGE